LRAWLHIVTPPIERHLTSARGDGTSSALPALQPADGEIFTAD
jgi:hypothetical protein